MTAVDWEILRRVPPRMITFLPGERVTRNDIQEILQRSPDCHVYMRPYITPQDMSRGEAIERYIQEIIAHCRAFEPVIPPGQRHLHPFNEQNMPRWSGWEGFGPEPEMMALFDRQFCTVYHGVKAACPSWQIGWSPLTIGNRDCWFEGDPIGLYYMHGPEGCVEQPTPETRRRAILSGPCYQSLLLADEYCAHVYIHWSRGSCTNIAYGMRARRYWEWLPKPMPIWITESGFPGRQGMQEVPWAMDDLIEWERLLVQNVPAVRGHSLWILGNHWDSSGVWYSGGQPWQGIRVLEQNPAPADAQHAAIPTPPIGAPPPQEPVAVDAIEALIVADSQRGISSVSFTRGYALSDAGAARGFTPASDEKRLSTPGRLVVYQEWFDPREAGQGYPTRHISWCYEGDWGNARWTRRANQ